MATAQDATRRHAIAEFRVIGEPPEPDLEGLVQLAAAVCGVSSAVINIIDDRHQHQIAAIGLEASMCTREDSMCAVVFQQPGHVIVPDARVDERFAANPFVTGAVARIRFYASSPLITPSGIPIGTLCVFDEEVRELSARDSAALVILARQVVDVLELRRMTRALRASNDQLQTFASQVSHDLRNPLTAVLGFIELAAGSPELAHAPRAAYALERAESAAGRMEAMIGELLDYARTGAYPRRTTIDLEAVLRTVVEDLDATLRRTPTHLVVDAAVEVRADETLLAVLLQNLVFNAIKFSAAGGVEPVVHVTAVDISGGWRITVDDNGPGIPLAERESVFELFERGGVTETDGAGIGLSTCRRIVEAHGGLIGIDDSPLGGASVWVILPDPAWATPQTSEAPQTPEAPPTPRTPDPAGRSAAA